MELLIGLAFGLAFGCIVGMVIVGSHVERECEQAYLAGHVDGYRKAQDDSGEVAW